jgi:hypothetical protein
MTPEESWIFDLACHTSWQAFKERDQAVAEVEQLRAALGKLKWKSIDKDNMEFRCDITCYVMDEIRAALEPKPTSPCAECAEYQEALREIERLRLRINSQELEVVRLQREKDAIGRELARRVLEPKS